MTTERRIWILGAPDPEMELIEALLRECGESVIHALDDRGERVHPGNAYRCPTPEVPSGASVYAVECIDTLGEGWVRVDHHRPGDPGYGRSPADFLTASSIGQVIDALARLGRLPASWPKADWPYRLRGQQRVGVHAVTWSVGAAPQYVACVAGDSTREVRVGQYLSPDERGTRDVYERVPVVSRICEIPPEYVIAAAADHCLAAAYSGECPGVDPDALMRWRVDTRAAFQGRPAEDILTDIERARAALREAPRIDLGAGMEVCDMRTAYTITTVLVEPFAEGATVDAAGVGNSTVVVFGPRDEGVWDEGSHHTSIQRGVPELPEAAAREGAAYLATVVERDGRTKVVIGGHTTPEVVRAFMERWAPERGLVGIYGNPSRGFAGGYMPEG